MRSSLPGRHELGQNFLVDRAVLDRIVWLVGERPGPIVEWGTGNGAITLALGRLGRPIEGIEIDPRRVRELKTRVGPHVCICEGGPAPPAAVSALEQRSPHHPVGGRAQARRSGRGHAAHGPVVAVVRIQPRPQDQLGRLPATALG
jgi:hypothetical protein